jgi:dienelactone hydrolase
MRIVDCPYACDGQSHLGKLVFDETSQARRPIVLLGPNWMGVSAEAVARAELLAANDYAVFIADLYGRDRQPRSIEQAGPLADALRRDAIEHRRRISVALEVATLRAAEAGVGDETRRAAIGFCFGGGSVLELARTGAALAAVVSIHGDLTTPLPATAGQLKASVLALHGSEDPISPRTHRETFETEMQAAKANWQLMVFGGVLHAFTDVGVDIPGLARFDAPATRSTYAMTQAFLRDAFSAQAELSR